MSKFVTWPNLNLPPINLHNAPHHGADRMKNPTLTEIRKDVEAKGGHYNKSSNWTTGYCVYIVNGVYFTKSDLIEAYKRGDLL
jgi:hypothetical protein